MTYTLCAENASFQSIVKLEAGPGRRDSSWHFFFPTDKSAHLNDIFWKFTKRLPFLHRKCTRWRNVSLTRQRILFPLLTRLDSRITTGVSQLWFAWGRCVVINQAPRACGPGRFSKSHDSNFSFLVIF